MGMIKQVGHVAGRDNALNAKHLPAANTAAVVTLSADTGFAYVLHNIQWSYSAAPTGGKLTITDSGNTIFEVDITAAGPGGLGVYLAGTLSATVVVTLAAGGGGIIGKLNVQYTKESNLSR